MLNIKKKEKAAAEQAKEKPIPAYLRPDYPYQAEGIVEDADSLETGVIYEIWCDRCQMSIRSQGQNIKDKFGKLRESGCIGCGNKDLKIRRVNMTANAEKNRKS